MTVLKAADFPVDDAFKRRVLERRIAYLFRQPSAEPEVIYVAGQPASGKSSVIEMLTGDHVILDSDELRKYHPALDEIMERDPLRMDVLTNGPVPYWMSSLIEYGRQHGHSLIIENTLSNSEFIAGEIAKFRSAGFRVRIVGLAVAQEVSRLGVVQRYLEAQRVSRYPRWTNEVSHTSGFKAIVPGLQAIAPLVDDLEIRSRDGRTLSGIEVIEAERATWFDSPAIRADWLARFDSCDMAGLEAEKLTQNLVADAERIRKL
ncbi:zeta toxin family protein [Corynebacterium aurimucosum]|uniref:zeta toxin family protein n=1 Tax=Corynebacterium aurimucosum TaxID=169292 RepID=UPI001F17655D|nr:zeta toxin family protein [Corynebacterium aurimucosum]